jgi:hypothetical protein
VFLTAGLIGGLNGMNTYKSHVNSDTLVRYLVSKLETLGDPVYEVKGESVRNMRDFDIIIRVRVAFHEPSGKERFISLEDVLPDDYEKNFNRAKPLLDMMYEKIEVRLWDEIANFEYPEPPDPLNFWD